MLVIRSIEDWRRKEFTVNHDGSAVDRAIVLEARVPPLVMVVSDSS